MAVEAVDDVFEAVPSRTDDDVMIETVLHGDGGGKKRRASAAAEHVPHPTEVLHAEAVDMTHVDALDPLTGKELHELLGSRAEAPDAPGSGETRPTQPRWRDVGEDDLSPLRAQHQRQPFELPAGQGPVARVQNDESDPAMVKGVIGLAEAGAVEVRVGTQVGA